MILSLLRLIGIFCCIMAGYVTVQVFGRVCFTALVTHLAAQK